MIETFQESHIRQAAALANAEYQRQCTTLEVLPRRDFTAQFLDEYRCLSENGLGVAMTEGDELHGFLLCYPPRISYYSGVRGVYCPLQGHSAKPESKIKIYQKLYQAASERWLAEGVVSHSITLYAQDQELVELFFQSGFGMNGADAIRDTAALTANCPVDCEIRLVPAEDAEELLPLIKGLNDHLANTPIFLPKGENPDAEKVAEWIRAGNGYYIGAYQNGKILSYLKIRSDGENFISNGGGTANLCGAYTLPEYRGCGMTTLLLSRLIDKLRSEGTTRCGVDCESYNPNAWHFWRKFFTLYTCSCVRILNPKIMGAYPPCQG